MNGITDRKLAMKVAGGLVVAISLIISFFSESKTDTDKGWQQDKAATSSQIAVNQASYQVKAVVDGDTVKVDIDGKTETLRLIGLDTPETVDPRKPVQCFGREASNKAKSLLEGRKVRLEADSTQGERDKYGRLLRYLFLEDGTSFNKLMIAEGYAHEYTYQSNPYKYQKEFKAAEKAAREGKLGLWSTSACSDNTAQPAASSSAATSRKK